MNDYDPNYIAKKVYALVGQKAVVLNLDNKILLLQRSVRSGAGGKWSLPGGAIEYNEDPFIAIRREIIEETQLKITDVVPFHIKSSINEDGDFIVVIGYQCKTETPDVILNWEHVNFKWLTKKQALEFDLTEDARIFIKHYQPANEF